MRKKDSEEIENEERILIPELNGRAHRLLPQEDIVKFMRSIKICPFCRGEKLSTNDLQGFRLTCLECGFQITSSHLYHHSPVRKRMKTVGDVVSRSIEEAVQEHEDALGKELTSALQKVKRIKEALDLHSAL